MQIVGLSQCFSRQKVVKIGKKRVGVGVTFSITTNYKTFSLLAYLRPTLLLVVLMRVLKGTL